MDGIYFSFFSWSLCVCVDVVEMRERVFGFESLGCRTVLGWGGFTLSIPSVRRAMCEVHRCLAGWLLVDWNTNCAGGSYAEDSRFKVSSRKGVSHSITLTYLSKKREYGMCN